MRRDISIMVKPSSSNCNLRCEYCFYHSLSMKRESYSHGLISMETMENVIRKALQYTNGGRIFLTFQGGEPLLRGKEFFQDVKKMIDRLNVKKSEVTLSVQTNGTLIDEEYCKALEGYLIGISLDGPSELNKYRIDSEGKPTFARVKNTIDLLKAHNMEFNVLSVVTKDIATHGGEVYDTFKSYGIRHIQFIPCLKPYGEKDIVSDMYMNGREYGEFLWRVFRRYYNDFMHGNYISIRMFDNFVRLRAGKSAEQCGMNGCCTRQFIIEGDGDVYPCDFYCLDEYRLGNINSDSFESMEMSDRAINFIKESFVIEEKCKECKVFPLCKNGCKRERGDVEKCEAYRYFLTRAMPYIERLTPYVR